MSLTASHAGHRFVKKQLAPAALGLFNVCLGLVVVFPIVYCAMTSFMPYAEMTTYPPKLFPSSFAFWDNYKEMLQKTLILRYMLNSLIMAAGGTLLRLVTAGTAAFSFSFFEYKGRDALFLILLGTMMIPGDAVIIANYINVSKLKLMDTYVGLFCVYGLSAANVFMMRQYMRTLPRALRDAALIDGCSNFRFFLRIVLPLATPVLFSVGISSFVNLWNAYIWPLLITNKQEMRVVQVGVTMLNTEETVNYGPVMAAVTFILIPSVLIFLLFQRRIVRGITAGSIKE